MVWGVVEEGYMGLERGIGLLKWGWPSVGGVGVMWMLCGARAVGTGLLK